MTNDMFLMIVFIVIWVYQILLLIKATKKRQTERWILLVIFEAVCGIFARIMIRYFDSLMPTGFMPGMVYFPHTILSIGALFLYLIMLVITIVSWITVSIMYRSKDK